MAIYFETHDPHGLLNAFDAAVAKNNHAGGIATWSKANGFYTHDATQWKNKAYLKPVISVGRLTFNIFKPQNGAAPSVVYGYYHGHLIETFLNHFDQMFTLGSATALPVKPDVFS